jgi:hypothetical protein
MSKTFLVATSVALSLLTYGCSTLADGSSPKTGTTKDFRYEHPLTAPTKLEVHDRNGPIRIEPGAGDVLEVVAVKTGRSADLDRVQVVAKADGGTIVVCALWPGEDASSCRAGSSPSGAADDDVRVRVELRLRVPAKVNGIDARTMNGEIIASSPAGELRVATMNGSVDVTGTGPIKAETMNGSVTAHASPGQPVELASKNGKVEVSLAASANADVQASTSNGRVTSDFGDVPRSSLPRLHDVRLRVGSGGTPISLRTLNGNVAVRRRS